MELKDILAKCDHTLLAQTATWEEIKAICDDGMKYSCASVCIPASHVKQAKEYVGEKLAICTVIGFPNGYATTAAKCFMASDAVDNGADEVDMVINIGWAKEGKWEEITREIAAIKAACKGKLLKVIIETCLLTDEEKIALCIRFRCGLYQDLHRFFQGRCHIRRCGAVRQACRAPCKDQSRRRHLLFGGCREVHRAGCFPPGYFPHRQDRQGPYQRWKLLIHNYK